MNAPFASAERIPATVPPELDWNLWLGTAPQKDYVDNLVPFNWRGWWDYGTGALGDMALHIIEPPFRVLGLVHDRANVTTVSPEVRMSLLSTGRFLTIFPTSAMRFPGGRAGLKVLPISLPIASLPNGIVTVKVER